MKTYKNLYPEIYSISNLYLAFKKARKGKTKREYVKEFEKNLHGNLKALQSELIKLTYKPRKLNKFIIRDPKTRTIHSSAFIDRIVHHALVNVIEHIFEKIFIHDSYASRKNKGTLAALNRFDKFKRKVSKNGQPVRNGYNNNLVKGYVLKADIKRYFDTVDHELLIKIIQKKIKDEQTIWLIKQIVNNFNTKIKGKGMPLGNLTSQFFANVYLNELDYFIKHDLKVRYYIRYVDDFVILHNNKEALLEYKDKIKNYLKNLKLELHPNKSKTMPLRDGVSFLGYRVFYHYKLLRKSNLRKFEKNFNSKLKQYKNNSISKNEIIESLQGWFGYARWANTYKTRNQIMGDLIILKNKPVDT